jgi:radical SAM superfamily enzyme YgiQ (UPF0313 family)
MRIALVYPPFGIVENQPNIKAVADNYGVFPPLNLSYVAAIAKNAGHKVRLIDANALNLSKEEILKEVKRFNPDVIAFTITTYMFYSVLKWAEFLKKNTGAKTLMGGAHMGLYPEETMSHDEIDYGIIGEAEETLPELIDALEKNKPLKNVKGICYKKGKKVMVTPKRGLVKDLDKIPFPLRDQLPNKRYCSFVSKKRNFATMITARGCPFNCIYCEQGGQVYRMRSAKNVVDEIEECYNNYNVKEIDFFDPEFTINKKHVMSICREIRKRNIKISWSCRSRIDTVDSEMLKEMAKAGCYRIYYGIESGVESILKTLKKGTNLGIIRKNIDLTKKNKIMTFGYFMVGSPGETKETIKKTVKFAKELNLDYAQFSKVSTLPGTELYELLKPQLGYDYWKGFILNEKNRRVLPRYKCNLSEKEIEEEARKAYIQFYFRPSYLIKKIPRTSSFSEIKTDFKAAFSMVFSR